MGAHTPGPWHHCRNGSDNFISNGRCWVARINSANIDEEANTYLIVAAPQLRAFAQKIAKPVEDMAALGWCEAVTLLMDLAREAQQLVAKADGAT